MDDRRAVIPGSELKHGNEACWSPAPCGLKIEVTIYIRPRDSSASEELLSGQLQPISREEAEAKLGANPQDMDDLRVFAEGHGLRVIGENSAARTITVEGTASQMESAFGVNLGMLHSGKGSYLSYKGSLHLPASLECTVVAVLGLDRRPIARTGEDR